jgi:hypothetical protein
MGLGKEFGRIKTRRLWRNIDDEIGKGQTRRFFS